MSVYSSTHWPFPVGFLEGLETTKYKHHKRVSLKSLRLRLFQYKTFYLKINIYELFFLLEKEFVCIFLIFGFCLLFI